MINLTEYLNKTKINNIDIVSHKKMFFVVSYKILKFSKPSNDFQNKKIVNIEIDETNM